MNEMPGVFAESYYDDNGQNRDRPALRLFTRLARRYIGRGRVLDFGCGQGHFLRHLARHFDACGLETSPWAREYAQRSAGLPVHASLDELADGSLDGIVSLHVVEHISDESLEKVLYGWHRVLVPRARLLVVTPDAGGYAAKAKGKDWIALTDPTHINLKSNEQWHVLFQAHGFDCVEEFADGLWDFPYRFHALGRAEVFLLGWPTLLQFLLARPLIPPGRGESVIYVLEKRG